MTRVLASCPPGVTVYNTRIPAEREALLARVQSLGTPPLTPEQEAYRAAQKAIQREREGWTAERKLEAAIADINAAYMRGMKGNR